ncbi:MAG: outer membrane protein assembly factor BamE [Paracoccaceae bacterium]|nr:outer membrane protein assembly factor BamE [Paracoccaceae bacterium]
MRLSQIMKSVAVLASVFVLSACAATYQNHGFVPSDDEMLDIIVGVDTKESVESAVGKPTSSGVLEDGAWYYVGSKFKHYAYKKPQEIDRQVLAISFGKSGRVSNIERFSLEDGRVVTLSRRVTDSNIKGVSFIRQLLGSFGRFNAGDFLGGG